MAIATRKKPTGIHHRRRHGQHHRQSKPYLKAYHPYIPMLLIVGLGIVINSVWSHSGVLGSQQDFSAQSLLQSTNSQRATESETSLSLSPELSQAAQVKANDMVSQNYWSHTSPNGQTPWSFIIASGYHYQSAGENLAYGFDGAESTVRAWMSSPEHRANILNAGYQNVGFGVAQTPDFQGHGPTTIVVAEYGQPVTTNFAVSNPDYGTAVSTRPVSRIQLLTSDQSGVNILLIVVIAGGGFTILLIRHSRRWHRVLVKGEAFVAHHPFLDIALTVIITAGVLLTRSSGMIR
jgi:uncharacterized protein YkwD